MPRENIVAGWWLKEEKESVKGEKTKMREQIGTR
jgi:hypothetical protein